MFAIPYPSGRPDNGSDGNRGGGKTPRGNGRGSNAKTRILQSDLNQLKERVAVVEHRQEHLEKWLRENVPGYTPYYVAIAQARYAPPTTATAQTSPLVVEVRRLQVEVDRLNQNGSDAATQATVRCTSIVT